MNLTEQFVEAASRGGSFAPQASVREAAKKTLADTIICMLAGANEPSIRILRELSSEIGGRGAATVVGMSSAADAVSAARTNGTAAHALDYDDVSLLMPGHPSTAVLPAVLAVADTVGTTGKDFLRAYIFGVEVCCRFGESVRVTHYKRGWHATGTIGAFGALAGVALLLESNRNTLVHATGILSSLVGGLQRNFGTMTKPLHAGQAAANAVWAVLAARKGFTADQRILESPAGFFEVFNGAVPASLPELEKIGSRSVFEEPGISLKRFPCNYALHRNVDAFLEVLSEHGIRSADIDRVECLIPPGEARPIMHARPRTGLEAKFSLEYVIASAALDGGLGFSSFADEAVGRREIADFLERVSKREDESCSGGAGHTGGIGQGHVEVIVHTKAGGRFSKKRAYPKGAPEDPLSWSEVESKALDCARRGGFRDGTARAVLDWIRGVENKATSGELATFIGAAGLAAIDQ